MKLFELIMVVSCSSEEMSEEQMMQRFNKFLDEVPKNVNRILYPNDTCLIELKVNDATISEVQLVNKTC